jgi:hypothetical protein
MMNWVCRRSLALYSATLAAARQGSGAGAPSIHDLKPQARKTATSVTRRPALDHENLKLALLDRLDHSLMTVHGLVSDWAAVLGRGVTR